MISVYLSSHFILEMKLADERTLNMATTHEIVYGSWVKRTTSKPVSLGDC